MEKRISLIHTVDNRAYADISSAIFMDILTDMMNAADRDTAHLDNRFYVPFTLASAAALEASLNDHVVVHSYRKYGENDYMRFCEGFFSASLTYKIDMVVPICSDGNFIINSKAIAYRSLKRLVKIRNNLTHPKSLYIIPNTDSSLDAQDDVMVIPAAAKERFHKAPIRSLNRDDTKAFYKAIMTLNTEFFYPLQRQQLEANELIFRRVPN